jgi:hypothetical protein
LGGSKKLYLRVLRFTGSARWPSCRGTVYNLNYFYEAGRTSL